jgi:hypothetical protein
VDDQQQDPDDDEARADATQHLAPVATGQIESKSQQGQHDQDEEDRHHFDDADSLLGGLELIRLHDHDLTRPRRSLDAQPSGQLIDERAQVQHHLAPSGRDPLALIALEHGNERRARVTHDALEEGLGSRALEEPKGRRLDGLVDESGDRCREGLSDRGESLLEPALDIASLDQPVGHARSERLLDVRVLDELSAGIRPGVRFQHLPLDPDRERPNENEERREDDQRPDGNPAAAALEPAGAFRSGRRSRLALGRTDHLAWFRCFRHARQSAHPCLSRQHWTQRPRSTTRAR